MMSKDQPYLAEIKQTNRVIHCITNSVSINDVANVILALGASPIMADSQAEAAEVTSIAGALLLNLGMPSEMKLSAMLKAGKTAKAIGIPILFDPVGAGISTLRNEAAKKILEETSPTVIRGNFSEVSFLVTGLRNVHGVDSKKSGGGKTIQEVSALAEAAAKRYGCILVLTGATDIVTDGKKTFTVHGGSDMMRSVTGTGDMLDGVIAAFLSVGEDDPLTAVHMAVCAMAIAGASAEETTRQHKTGIGSFRTALMDVFWAMEDEGLYQVLGSVSSQQPNELSPGEVSEDSTDHRTL